MKLASGGTLSTCICVQKCRFQSRRLFAVHQRTFRERRTYVHTNKRTNIHSAAYTAFQRNDVISVLNYAISKFSVLSISSFQLLYRCVILYIYIYIYIYIYNQQTYLIKQLKWQGLPQEQLQNVFDAVIVSRLLYAAPAWRGYLRSAEIDSLQSVLDKDKRWQLIRHEYNVVDLLDKCNRTLFKSSLCLSHSLNHLFPDKRHHTYLMSLRPRGHDFSLPQLKYRLSRCSFVNRSLFSFVLLLLFRMLYYLILCM